MQFATKMRNSGNIKVTQPAGDGTSPMLTCCNLVFGLMMASASPDVIQLFSLVHLSNGRRKMGKIPQRNWGDCDVVFSVVFPVDLSSMW